MQINRTIVLREPGKIIFDGAHLYFQSDIVVKPVITNAALPSLIHGTIDTRSTNRMFTISGTLAGEYKDLAKLYAVMGVPRGRSVFGAVDKALVIHCESGLKITFANAAITKPPAIIGRVGATMFGAFEATCILKNSSDPGTAANYYTVAAEAYPGDAAFDPSVILTLPLTAAWGEAAPWDSFLTRAGWTITPQVTLSPDDVDGLGTIDLKVQDITCTATATPAGITQAQLYAALGHGSGLGARRAGNDLVLTADGVWIKLTDAVMTDGDSGHGDRPTVGEATWTARRAWDDGALLPLLAVDVEDPDAE